MGGVEGEGPYEPEVLRGRSSPNIIFFAPIFMIFFAHVFFCIGGGVGGLHVVNYE